MPSRLVDLFDQGANAAHVKGADFYVDLEVGLYRRKSNGKESAIPLMGIGYLVDPVWEPYDVTDDADHEWVVLNEDWDVVGVFETESEAKAFRDDEPGLHVYELMAE